MIATTLFGGMGNQMFIYAMARAMALRNGVSASFNIVDGFKYDFYISDSWNSSIFV